MAEVAELSKVVRTLSALVLALTLIWTTKDLKIKLIWTKTPPVNTLHWKGFLSSLENSNMYDSR